MPSSLECGVAVPSNLECGVAVPSNLECGVAVRCIWFSWDPYRHMLSSVYWVLISYGANDTTCFWKHC